jgi:hypothetical protein
VAYTQWWEQAGRGKLERRLLPWTPELFSAPVLARIEERRREQQRSVRRSVRCFDGLLTGKIDALIGSFGSFAGEPEVRHPVRGRAKGASAVAQLVTTRPPGWPSATSLSRTSASSSRLRAGSMTAHERQIAWLARDGLSSPEIGARLVPQPAHDGVAPAQGVHQGGRPLALGARECPPQLRFRAGPELSSGLWSVVSGGSVSS